ncbi:hypothetical protein ILUMI_26570, partial [Ignelater luminosus]
MIDSITDLDCCDRMCDKNEKDICRKYVDQIYDNLKILQTFVEQINRKNGCLKAINDINRNLSYLMNDYIKLQAQSLTKNETFKNIIIDSINNAMSSQIKPTFAQITASKSNIEMINKPKYKTYIFPKEEIAAATSKDTKRILTSVELQLLKIKPDRVIKVKNKGVLIESLDPEITKLTNNKDLSRLGLEARLPEKVWRRLIFYNVPSSLPDKEFLTCVLNNINDEMIQDNNWYKKIFKLGARNQNTTNWVLEINSKIRKIFITRGRAYFGWTACPVADFIRISRCYKCQRFGHISKFCKSQSQCGICSSVSHKKNECGVKNNESKHKCANCLRNDKKDSNHSANSNKCPFYKIRLADYLSSMDYGPPYSSHNTFVQEFELLYSHLLLISEKIIFLEDFNFDVLSLNKPGIQQYLDMLDSLNIAQLIGKPTRITDKTSTLLDHILTSDIDIIRSSSIEVNHNISDHCVIFCELNLVSSLPSPKLIKYRSFRTFNYIDFTENLRNVNWHMLYRMINIDEKLIFFNNTILSLFDIYAPVRKAKITKKSSPWLKDDLKRLMNTRDNTLKSYRRTNDVTERFRYKTLKNLVNRLVVREKKAYIEEEIQSDNSKRNLYKVLNEMGLGHKQHRHNLPDQLSNINAINNYFVNSAKNSSHTNNELVEYYNANLQLSVTEPFTFSFIDEDL